MEFELPKDPDILLGMINMKLRDYYDTLDQLCEDMNIDRDLLTSVLGDAGYEYIKSIHQFHRK
jgi:hypothetical protein